MIRELVAEETVTVNGGICENQYAQWQQALAIFYSMSPSDPNYAVMGNYVDELYNAYAYCLTNPNCIWVQLEPGNWGYSCF